MNGPPQVSSAVTTPPYPASIPHESPDFERMSTPDTSPHIERTSTPHQPPTTPLPDNARTSATTEAHASTPVINETSILSAPHDRSPAQVTCHEPEVPPHPRSYRLLSATRGPGWTPTHAPSWLLGPQHNGYVHNAAPYLLGVPGGPKWEILLTSFIRFEGLSSSQPVSMLFF